jgi:hypothetical protein
MPTRRALLALPLVLGAACSAPALAVGRLVDVEIVDRTRREQLPLYRHAGLDWIAGRPGDRYAVQLVNRTPGRVLVVLSVDGVNAVSGETAAIGQSGYVLDPWQRAEITGWRKSDREAAAFYFTSIADSYAARTDRPDNVGVIGVAVFRERPRPPEPRAFPSAPLARREAAPPAADGAAGAESSGRLGSALTNSADASAAPAQPSAKAEQRLGTGHGEREYSPVSPVAFERASRDPAEVVRVRYDSEPNLVAMGVIGRWRAPWSPDPFPQYVPDPR